MRYALKKEKTCFFKATTGDICYNYRSLQNVRIFDINQSKGGERKYKGGFSHVLVAQKPLKHFNLNEPGLPIEGTGYIYKYKRADGSRDFSFRVNSARIIEG